MNEVQIESINGSLDNAGESEPWVELHNAGPTTLSLDSYFLADNYTTNLTQWAFPSNATISAGQFKLIFADSQTNQSTADELHTDSGKHAKQLVSWRAWWNEHGGGRLPKPADARAYVEQRVGAELRLLPWRATRR
jgi:hypothetical protein